MRHLIYLAWVLSLITVGCGGGESESPIGATIPFESDKAKPPLGLHEDTYRNQRHVFKVSNLPVDNWRILIRSDSEDLIKIAEWDEALASKRDRPFVLLHQIKADSPPSETYLLMQPTEHDHQSTFRKAFDNQTPFLSISIEGQTVPDRSSMREFIALYVAPKKEFITDTSQKSIVTSVGSAQSLKATVKADGSKIVYTLLLRTRTDPNKIFRFIYWSPANHFDEFLSIYEGIISSFEANIT
ncbi:MAG: hypothetical protein OXN17_16520 [Candidatus Poribacteria bacterium]|nr:hypothetical protein [Candidatus Poribacteria bacterium]